MTEAYKGLTDSEVQQSRRAHGENRLSRRKKKGFFRSFLASFGDPMIKILLIALAVNVLFTFRHADWFESTGIAVAILLATLVSTVSEYGSESAFEKLQEQAAKIDCRVRRAGRLTQLSVDQIVVGDIVQLQAGDRVPADGVLLEGRLDVDQSALNGESKEAKKFPAARFAGTGRPAGMGADRQGTDERGAESENLLVPSRLFSGTIVCAGEGVMRVTRVGDATFFGKIGAEIQQETRESPLKVRLGKLAGAIGKFGYAAAGVTILAYLFKALVMDNGFSLALMRQNLTSAILIGHLIGAVTLAVTVVVMAVPEGLPMMITVVLSSNMKRMLHDNVLVRKLVGIETAGSLNILFTDKTGTLTKGKLEVTYFITGEGAALTRRQIAGAKTAQAALLRGAVTHNCAAAMGSAGAAIGGNATDRAVLTFVSEFAAPCPARRVLHSIPFTSDLKFMATAVAADGGREETFLKGAPEKLLPFCTQYIDEMGRRRSLTKKEALEAAQKAMADKAVRLIAVAVADAPMRVPQGAAGTAMGTGAGGVSGTAARTSTASAPPSVAFPPLTLIGLLGIRDDIRREAVTGVRQVRSAGIQTVMITGDARATALAIAREAGLVTREGDRILTGEEMAKCSDEELSRLLPSLRVVARALPGDKSRLVRIAQEKGLVVGMTGDGVNDAPALKAADIGFSMGSGTEVAKEASDVIILDDNFLSIAKAISYGRTIFKSIRKFIIYQMSICMCAVGVTVLGPLLGVTVPITVIQMLWINIVMDTLAGLAFSGERARKAYMEEPPKKRNEPMLNGYMKSQIAVSSIYSTALCLFFLKSPLFVGAVGMQGDTYKMTAFFGLFMFLAIFTSFCARTHSINLTKYLAANKAFLFIMGLVTVCQLTILYFGGAVFRVTPLDAADLLLVVVLALTVFPVDALRKAVLRRHVGSVGT